MKFRKTNANNSSNTNCRHALLLPVDSKVTMLQKFAVVVIVLIFTSFNNNSICNNADPTYNSVLLVSAFAIPTFSSGRNIRIRPHPHHPRGFTNLSRFGSSHPSSLMTTTTTTSSSALSSVTNPFNGKNIGVILAIFLAALVLPRCFYVVDAGSVGIASTLGNIERYDPGLHIRNPLITNVINLSTKTELLEQSNFVPTKEGLTVELDTAVLLRLDPDNVLDLYRTIGPDYVNKLVVPEASSSVRGLTSESEAKALYTSGRNEIQNRLSDELTDKLGPKGIVVEDVLLKNVVLPEDLSNSIQEKARAEQESARMEFTLLKETQEAERKAIEAKGIADFQNIVSKGITPSLLQWKGIEATEKLAESPNSKVIIIGNSKDSLPVILGSGGGN